MSLINVAREKITAIFGPPEAGSRKTMEVRMSARVYRCRKGTCKFMENQRCQLDEIVVNEFGSCESEEPYEEAI